MLYNCNMSLFFKVVLKKQASVKQYEDVLKVNKKTGKT